MADVEEDNMFEEVFENEISVNEIIEYVADEIFPKFPEFCSLFESIEEIKQILRKRVTSIERQKTNYKDRASNNSLACYIPKHNKVIFYADKPITINYIKNSYIWKNTFTHEFIHAATDKTKDDKYFEVGCSSSGKKNRFVIFKEMVLSHRSLQGKSIIEKIKNMFKKIKYMSTYDLGESLNEGLTTWITDKMVSYVKNDGDTYPWEKNFIDSIEDMLGTEETLDLIRCDYKKIAKKLDISKSESILLMRYMDIASCISKGVHDSDIKENEPEKYKKYVKTYYDVGGTAQKFFIEKFFIPKSFEKTINSINNGKASVYDLINLYNTMQKFKNYIVIEGIEVEEVLDSYSFKTFYEETFDNFEKYLKIIFIAFSDYVDVSKYTDEEIFNTKGIYDYLFEKTEERFRINAEFYKYLTERVKKIENKQKIMVAINKSKVFVPGSPVMDGMSFKDLACGAIKKHNISTSDVTIGRRERRALERKNKKIEQKQRQNQDKCENANK